MIQPTDVERNLMGFQTPLYELSDYLKWTTTGKIQLPDFQRGYKWEDERIRQLLVTILRGHPLGVVMLLEDRQRSDPLQAAADRGRRRSGRDARRVAPARRSAAADVADAGADGQRRRPHDGQPRKADGAAYYVDMELALEGEDRIDEAVLSVPGDGIVRTNFGKDIVRDVSTPEKEREHGLFPLRLLFDQLQAVTWLVELGDNDHGSSSMRQVMPAGEHVQHPGHRARQQHEQVSASPPSSRRSTPAASRSMCSSCSPQLSPATRRTSPSTGPTSDSTTTGRRRRLKFASYPVLAGLENTDFLQAVTLLATRKRNLAGHEPPPAGRFRQARGRAEADARRLPRMGRPAARGVHLGVQLPGRPAHLRHPVPAVPEAARPARGDPRGDGPRRRPPRGPREARALVLVRHPRRAVRRGDRDPIRARPRAGARRGREAKRAPSRPTPSTTQRSSSPACTRFALAAPRPTRASTPCCSATRRATGWRTRRSTWCSTSTSPSTSITSSRRSGATRHGIDDERRESIVNKTAISAVTNRTIGGAAPSSYLQQIETKAQIEAEHLDALLEAHLVPADRLRADDFDGFFVERRDAAVRSRRAGDGQVGPPRRRPGRG